MSITPLHLIAGVGVKALAPKLDYIAFAAINVAIDLEPAFAMLGFFGAEDPRLHGTLHTAIGACGLALFYTWAVAGTRATLLSSLFAALSHVLIDGLYHGDTQPFWPFSPANFSGILPAEWIDYGLLAFGLAVPVALWKHCRSIGEIQQAWSTGFRLHRKGSD